MPPTQYNGWLVSPNFLKRAFAVLGHAFVAQLIIAIPFWILGSFYISMIFHQLGGIRPVVIPQMPSIQQTR